MKRMTAICVVAIAAWSLTGAAGGESRTAASQAVEVAPDSMPRPRESIRVASAQSLLNQQVVSADGRRIGRIEAVMLDISSADAVFAVVSPAGAGDSSELMLIPFGALALHPPAEGPIHVGRPYDKIIEDSPRVPADRLSDWMKRDRVAESYRRYGVPTPYGYVIAPDPKRERFPNRYLLVRPGALPGAAPEKRQADRALADDLRGAHVRKQNGEVLGEVDYVLLDLESGRVAFALVYNGKDWIPVPLQAIAWTSDKGLAVKAGTEPDAFRPESKTGLPTQVPRSQLEALYKRFNIRPYQEQSGLN